MTEFLSTLKDSLEQYETLKILEAKTKIPKEQICIGELLETTLSCVIV